MQIVEISEHGISVLRGMPQIVKVLADVEDNAQDPISAENLERAKKEAELASDEVAKNFPVLHGFSVVALWSWLEHFVKGIVALWQFIDVTHWTYPSFKTTIVSVLCGVVGLYGGSIPWPKRGYP